jgi:hypothetical protein
LPITLATKKLNPAAAATAKGEIVVVRTADAHPVVPATSGVLREDHKVSKEGGSLVRVRAKVSVVRAALIAVRIVVIVVRAAPVAAQAVSARNVRPRRLCRK